MDENTLMWIDDKGGFDAICDYLSSKSIFKETFELCVQMFYIFHEQLINHDWSDKDNKASSEIIHKYDEGFYKTDAELNHLLLCIFIIIKKRAKFLNE